MTDWNDWNRSQPAKHDPMLPKPKRLSRCNIFLGIWFYFLLIALGAVVGCAIAGIILWGG